MPNKYNPVGAEFIKQIYFKILGNDTALSAACAEGEFELNPMLPLIGELLLENIELLRDGVNRLNYTVIKEISANESRCRKYLEESPSVAALLIEKIGYDELTEILKESERTGKSYKEIMELKSEG